MKQVLIRQGKAVVEEVPAPGIEPGTVIVRTLYSCISTGTELSGIRASAMPVWKRALRRPAHVAKVVDVALASGWRHAADLVRGKLNAATATGYSAAGIVSEVAGDVQDVEPGDLVACAGAQCAHHAELIRVPRNLLAVVPAEVDAAAASTVTLGAIALQGVRRTAPTLGEAAVVVGLGALGQLTVQILKANGCRVVAIDIDRRRGDLALQHGADLALLPGDAGQIDDVLRFTAGIGADAVIVTASTPSDEVMSTAFRMCRRKARVVLVGDVGLNLNRADMYEKELDFLISTSYGPGRYDARYEEHGMDYPVAYVRWTENRNMAEYLRLLACRLVRLDGIADRQYELDAAADAYACLQAGEDRPLLTVLRYPPASPDAGSRTVRLRNLQTAAAPRKKLRVAVVGAGAFARGVHLPNLRSLSDRFEVRAIVSRTGHAATEAGRQFGAAYATTDVGQALGDPEVDAVIVTTRHDTHVDITLAALAAGKHVLVEKPTATTADQLSRLERHLSAVGDGSGAPLLMTGYNRRFSPLARRLHDWVGGRGSPMIINYRMNAGYLPPDHWVHGPQGGGRNIGEACHLYDLFVYLTGSRAVGITADTIRPANAYYRRDDNFATTIRFADGSLANLVYCALGSPRYPKETCEVFVDGKVFVLSDYVSLEPFADGLAALRLKVQDKGQRAELEAFADAIVAGANAPMQLWEQLEVMRIAFEVERQIGGRT